MHLNHTGNLTFTRIELNVMNLKSKRCSFTTPSKISKMFNFIVLFGIKEDKELLRVAKSGQK